MHDPSGIEPFIVRAKAACYAGGGAGTDASRPGSHDLAYAEGGLSYRDSYFGGTDFIGQEVVWSLSGADARPVWAMNYYGYILRPDLVDAAATGALIKAALSALYREARFLGGFRFQSGEDVYHDENSGTWRHFHGQERIMRTGTEVYRLDYHGGLIWA